MSEFRTTSFSMEDEVEGAEVDEDGFVRFSDKQWEDNNKKKRKRMTKEDMIYGIWNDTNGDGSEEEDEEQGAGRLLRKQEESLNFSLEQIQRPHLGMFRKSNTLLQQPNNRKVKVSVIFQHDHIKTNQKSLREVGESSQKGGEAAWKNTKKKKVRFGGEEVIDLETNKRKFKQLYDEREAEQILAVEEQNDDQEYNQDADTEQEERERLRKKRVFDFSRKQINGEEKSAKDLYQDEDENTVDEYLNQTLRQNGAQQNNARKTVPLASTREQLQKEREMQKNYGKGHELLKKFGWTGRGLGKNEQGISKPVEAVFKTQLTASDLGRSRTASNKANGPSKAVIQQSQAQEEEEEIVVKRAWQKDNGSAQHHKIVKKQVFKGNFFQFLDPNKRNQQQQQQSQASHLFPSAELKAKQSMKIIDMTGAQTVEYGSMQDLLNNEPVTEQRKESQNSSQSILKRGQPPLQDENEVAASRIDNSLQQLKQGVKKRNNTVKSLEHRLKYEQDQLMLLEHEAQQLSDTINLERQEADQTAVLQQALQKILQGVDLKTVVSAEEFQIGGEQNPVRLTSQELLQQFSDCFKKTKDAFVRHNCENIFMRLFEESFAEEFAEEWNKNTGSVQYERSQLHATFAQAVHFLQSVLIHREAVEQRPYKKNATGRGYAQDEQTTVLPPKSEKLVTRFKDFVVQRAVLPVLRTYILTNWEPKSSNADNLIDFLDAWSELIAQTIKDDLFEQLVLPKLKQEIEALDLLSEKLPVHLWLHTWLLVVEEEKLRPLWQLVMRKISLAVLEWNLLDAQVLAVIRPWQKVFEPQQFETLITRAILPKMLYCVQELVIDPANQDITAIDSILQWQPLLQDFQLDIVFEALAIRLHELQIQWLAIEYCEKQEVLQWVEGWKSFMGQRICALPGVRAQLDAMQL